MGNSDSSFSDPKIKKMIQEQYQFRGDVEDERTGKIAVYNHKFDTRNQVMFKKMWANTIQDSEQLHNFIQTRRNLKHKNLSTLPFYEVSEERQMLSTFFHHVIGFEYYPKTLKTELEFRRGVQESQDQTQLSTYKYYSESEVWYIINVLVSVLKVFKDYDYPHGDI